MDTPTSPDDTDPEQLGGYFSKRRIDSRRLAFIDRSETLMRLVDEYADSLGRGSCPVETKAAGRSTFIAAQYAQPATMRSRPRTEPVERAGAWSGDELHQ
jgi:hypothetical protein